LRIPFNRGICGQVASSGKPRLINDVSSVQNHIACSPTTKSELVVPVLNGVKSLIAVLDIDSDLPAAFNDDDTNGLLKIINSIFSKDIM
jgi:GAF domain-containing protein